MNQTSTIMAFLAVLACFLSGCASVKPEGDTVEERRQFIEDSMKALMANYEKQTPDLPEKLENSVGYAIFRYRASKLPMVLSGFGGGKGFGLARDMETGELTYMKITKTQWGVGMGTRELGALFIFSDRAAFEKFISGKWDAGGGVEATAKGGEKGGGMEGAATTKAGFEVIQITESGLSYGATWRARKFSPDKSLN